MERMKQDYLNKILEQIDKQNIEYYTDLASEYEVQKQTMLAKEETKFQSKHNFTENPYDDEKCSKDLTLEDS